MRSITRLLAALVVFLGASLAVTAPAAAVPTVAFSVSSVGLTVGVPATYAADVVCDVEPCRYQWRWYRVIGNDRLGTTMGEGLELRYAFDTPGLKNVVLRVTNATRTHGFAAASQVLEVMPVNDEEPSVDPTDPVHPPMEPPVEEATPVDEPPLPPVGETTPVEIPTLPTIDQPTTPAFDPVPPVSTDPAAPSVQSTCPESLDPMDPAPTTEPPAPLTEPTCTATVDPGTAVTHP
jgi:hypothetical protein